MMQDHGFTWQTLKKDAVAGTVTGLLAIPLTVGICLMSEYPVKVGLATVIAACVISFVAYLFRPGNHVGVPGVAAGLAPVLAAGIHQFGMERMPWIICLTSLMQALVWKYRWEKYLLRAVPPFLIEGLLAGVGLKIAAKFLPYTWAVAGTPDPSETFWSHDRMKVVALSVAGFLLFLHLYRRFKDRSPGVPYLAVIGGGAWIAAFVQVPMLEVKEDPIRFAIPLPDFKLLSAPLLIRMSLYAAMLALIDVIEQVMSNAAIEKIDPLHRKSDSNNSLLVMWTANLFSSFFGGMTNLDGLAKSSTNRMAGAVTKMSVLFVAGVLGAVLVFPHWLSRLPEFSLAVLMIFTGWKMIAGMVHVAKDGKYAFALALFCGVLVFKLGIFEGLLLALGLHTFISLVIFRHDQLPMLEILGKLLKLFSEPRHPHTTETLDVNVDPTTGGLRYSSIRRNPAD
jgi:MFS superfamily sulfate permease-like transporter